MTAKTTIERRRGIVHRYLERRQLYPFQVSAEPDPALGLVVVIPCFDEPDISGVLRSLASCDRPEATVEVLVVINAATDSATTVLERNRAAAEVVNGFAASAAPDWMRPSVITQNELPGASAGVGMARKLGMDEAAHRLARTRAARGVIASLDADCHVKANYLTTLEHEFHAHAQCPGASVYFEHDMDSRSVDARSILGYELHLRYCIAGQREARFPYAFHTIGSAMACRSDVYAAQGGMNLRQGGEDFYFAQKLIALGEYRSITGTCVYPSARISNRVPFGTGPAMARAASGQPTLTFAPVIFEDLRAVCAVIREAQPDEIDVAMLAISDRVSAFLREHGFGSVVDEARTNVGSATALRKRLFRWFNAFRFMKFAQHASRNGCPRVPVQQAARSLSAPADSPDQQTANLVDLLGRYRAQDRAAAGPGAMLG